MFCLQNSFLLIHSKMKQSRISSPIESPPLPWLRTSGRVAKNNFLQQIHISFIYKNKIFDVMISY